MSKRSESSRPVKPSKAKSAPTSTELARELALLNQVADNEIDMTGMPAVLDWSEATVGKYYRPIKEPVSLRMDADVLAWLRGTGKGYQSRLNDLVRMWMNLSYLQKNEPGLSAKKTMEVAAKSYTARNAGHSKQKAASSKQKGAARRRAG